MNRLDQRGAINILLVPLVLSIIFFVGALGFGFWAFASRQDYKDNVDQKVAVAQQEAVKATQEADAAKYAEDAKKPLETYIGPAAFGNITVNYPKTWSAYAVENQSGGKPISTYFHPKTVPDAGDEDNAFALRVELVQRSYDQVVNSFSGALKSNKVTLEPYKLPKVPSVVGSRITGQITSRKQGVMIVLPLRNMTLQIWTESADFLKDLDENILPNLSFVP
jgi:hypothetical protein